MLGAKAICAFLMFSTSTGILMALFLNNAGGAWDNAKKYIESGECGGKGSDAHKASVTGDTVGDPCKDVRNIALIEIVVRLIFCRPLDRRFTFLSSYLQRLHLC